jgi:hypothetical protein
MRRQFQPEELRLLIVAESPPESGLYFYDPSGRPSEPIFTAFMEQLGVRPETKPAGLMEMQRRGWLLVDATYEQIDKKFKRQDPNRDAVLVRDYPILKQDIRHLSRGDEVPILLIKANVCRVLDQRLVADGFTVLNQGRRIPLPMNGNQPKFRQTFREILVAARLLP